MQTRSEETRTKIIQTANHLFSQSGYEAASVAEICQAAGVSKGAFYHHFPSKQALFLELMNEWLRSLESGFETIRGQAKNVPQALEQMADMAGGLLTSSNIHLPIFLEFWVQAQRDPQIWQVAIAPYRHYLAFFTGLIQEGIQEGSIRAVDPEQSARMLVSLALGLLMQALFDPKGADWVSETQGIVQLFL